MEGMKTLDIRSYRETIKAAVAHERLGCLFMHPDAKGPHGAAQGPAGANAKRPPRA